MKKDIVKAITRNAVVAAIYFLLTFASQGVAFGPIQIRVAEALVLLCFFRRDFTIGITLGCLLSNLFSPYFPWDLVIGTAATLISCLLISCCKHLLIATIFPVAINGIAIGAELTFLYNYEAHGFWITSSFILIGELLAVSVIGYLCMLLLRRNNSFLEAIGANKNLDFKW